MKTKTVWSCSECGQNQVRWSGQCSGCGNWNCLVEEIEKQVKQDARFPTSKEKSKPVRLHEIALGSDVRVKSGLHEFDRAIGGGIVAGQVTLIGGDPGIGKSTIALQLASALSQKGISVLYVSGEESLEQISLRAKRLQVAPDSLFFLNEIEVDEIVNQVETIKPSVLIIDSIQIVYHSLLTSAPGSVSQVRQAAATFVELAKKNKIATFLIGHVTKSGEIAGPKVLEHLVDTVLYFEGDRQQNLRILRVVKNRFGPTDEIAVFQMYQAGLVEVANPSLLFLEERSRGTTGSCVIPTLEGTRPFLVEVQSLVTNTFYQTPSRRSTGIDPNRLALLIAVLEKRTKLQLYKCDVFVAATGGIHISEPACDLGIALSIASSYANRPIDGHTLVIGEVGLGGEIRPVTRIESRIKEAHQMGFKRCICPQRNLKAPLLKEIGDSIQLSGVQFIDEVMQQTVLS